ncbi:MAG: energy transducer TonB [Bacteroidetes bacterium]|nr:energy transducer TonB [Bacteroidota bacterium]MBU1373423.1 energy transducer TonB [Bacteroidota bacterium]MBU1483882.1 energy transducer TonB [Bacteroidota bacterium]MBU1759757.1 energy transducer TonB [Bacteroidota bacterium]MBU2375632.1 energy transducer TonB [Bacteroidota bacterium]
MRKLRYTLTLLVCFGFLTQAQETTVYYHNNNEITKNTDSATYYIKFSKLDNGSFAFQRYCMDNILKEKGTVQNISTLIKDGEITTFYTNGNIMDKTNFIAGLPGGIQIHYFADGTVNYKTMVNSAGYGFTNQAESDTKYLFCATPDHQVILEDGNGYFKAYNDQLEVIQEGAVVNTFADGTWKGYENNQLAFVEIYKNGVLIKGENFSLDGNVYQYAQRNRRPEPKGGINSFYNYIASSLQSAYGIDAKIMMKFIVDPSGNLKNIEVINSSNKKINSLAISALKNAPKWNPAIEQGKPIQFAYYMPINIKN